MLTIAIIIQIALMLGVTIAVAVWLNRGLKLPWVLFLGGALAYTVAWIIVALLPMPPQIALLLSSVIQMGALYAVYRFMLNTVHTEREALMVGAGLAGIELLIVVVFLIIPSFVQMSRLRSADDETLISLAARSKGIEEAQVQPEDIDELRSSIDEFWSTPAYVPFLQAAAILAELPVQMALAIIVLGAVVRGSLQPLVGAMALHFLSKSLPSFASLLAGVVAWTLVSALVAGAAVWFIRRLWPLIQEQKEAVLKGRHRTQKQPERA